MSDNADPDVLARQRERDAALHAEAHVHIEKRLDGHDKEIGALQGEQGLQRERLGHGSKSMAEQRARTDQLAAEAQQRDAEAKADRSAFKNEVAELRAEIKPKPWSTWAKALAGGVSLGFVLAVVSLIVFIARLPSGDDVKAVRHGVIADVERARSAAQAVEVRQAELGGTLGGELKVIKQAQDQTEKTTQQVVDKLDELDKLIRQAPGKEVRP